MRSLEHFCHIPTMVTGSLCMRVCNRGMLSRVAKVQLPKPVSSIHVLKMVSSFMTLQDLCASALREQYSAFALRFGLDIFKILGPRFQHHPNFQYMLHLELIVASAGVLGEKHLALTLHFGASDVLRGGLIVHSTSRRTYLHIRL